MKNTRQGTTLIELLIVIAVFSILLGACAIVFRTILVSWDSQEKRTGVDIILDRGLEETVRILREAKNMDALNNDEVRYTTTLDAYNIFYLYNSLDSYPPAFTQSTYELRRTALAGVAGGDLKTGTFTYGDGRIVITSVLPPPTTDLSISGNRITIDISVKRSDETIRLRTKVKVRNK